MATLVDAVKVNLARGAQDVALFEVGRAYRASRMGEVPRTFSGETVTPDDVAALDAALGEQPRRVAGIMTGSRLVAGWDGPAEPFAWTDALAAVERVLAVTRVPVAVEAAVFAPWHPGRCAAYYLDGFGLVGVAGELHPKVLETLGLPPRTVAFELVLDPLVALSEGMLVTAEPVAPHSLAKEDFAFVVDQAVPAGALVAVVREAGGELVEDVRVFDVYAGAQVGEGKKSLALNVVMRAPDRTLTPEEVLAVRQAVVAAAARGVGAVLR